MSTDDTNAARRGSGSNDQLGQTPTRAQVNAWMAEAGWQNSAIRQADLDGVERVVRTAVAAERERLRAAIEAKRCTPMFPGGHSFNYGIEAALDCVKA